MTDVVLFGATGFVGKLTAAYLAAQGHHVGLAGRSKDKLEAVRRDLGPAAADWPLIVADSSDVASIKALASSAKAVATTVGPYAKYGLPLLEACARAGTHYADLTGEVLFHREAIDRFHDVAVASGARVVPSCGLSPSFVFSGGAAMIASISSSVVISFSKVAPQCFACRNSPGRSRVWRTVLGVLASIAPPSLTLSWKSCSEKMPFLASPSSGVPLAALRVASFASMSVWDLIASRLALIVGSTFAGFLRSPFLKYSSPNLMRCTAF